VTSDKIFVGGNVNFWYQTITFVSQTYFALNIAKYQLLKKNACNIHFRSNVVLLHQTHSNQFDLVCFKHWKNQLLQTNTYNIYFKSYVVFFASDCHIYQSDLVCFEHRKIPTAFKSSCLPFKCILATIDGKKTNYYKTIVFNIFQAASSKAWFPLVLRHFQGHDFLGSLCFRLNY